MCTDCQLGKKKKSCRGIACQLHNSADILNPLSLSLRTAKGVDFNHAYLATIKIIKVWFPKEDKAGLGI